MTELLKFYDTNFGAERESEVVLPSISILLSSTILAVIELSLTYSSVSQGFNPIIGISLLPATLLISNIVGVISILLMDMEVKEIRDNEKKLWVNKDGIYATNPELDWTVEADKKEKDFRDTNKI